MSRAPGTPNKGKHIDNQRISYKRRVWTYDGTLFPDRLVITRVNGDLDRPGELDGAIKAECRRLGVTVELEDPRAADAIFGSMAVAPPEKWRG